MVLEKIHKCNDIKSIPTEMLPVLAGEIREFLIDKISLCGGHLASNLGVVELTMALHLCLDLPTDKIIWDVGHQAYTHKILTGRSEGFNSLRKYKGMSGFPKRSESPCDVFDTGHSSTSISAGLGMVCARDLNHDSFHVVSVIGDGSLTGGMAYEALNNAASVNRNFIIILNDNDMSISKNVGGMSRYLSGIRTYRGYNNLKENIAAALTKIPGIGNGLVQNISRTKNGIKQLMIPGMLFENMGITYLGPVDGHDLDALVQVINDAKKLERAVLIHVRTQKGRGYDPAVLHPENYHGVAPFDKENGEPKAKKKAKTYTGVFSDVLCRIGENNPSVTAITAAMADGTGMTEFSKRFPERFFDVGIAEEHAVTFAAGMAVSGFHPVVAIYSSFLQRAFDQIIHDVCLQNLPVTFAIDRSGLVGDDGETHQGVFDISYLTMMPNMTVFAPKNRQEMEAGMEFAVQHQGPFAIRYPKTAAYEGLSEYCEPICLGKSEMIERGRKIALLAFGSMVETAEEVSHILKEKGYTPTFVNLRFAKPLDFACIDSLLAEHEIFVTMEENVLSGGIGEAIGAYLSGKKENPKVLSFGIPDAFVPHGTIAQLKKDLGLDAAGITERICSEIGRSE